MALHQLKYPYRTILKPMAQKISFIHPDVFSWCAFVVTFLTGYCFYAGWNNPILFIIAAILILCRMTLNTLDGVVAIERGDDSKTHGKIINALPDRYGDLFVVGGILLSPIVNTLIGLLGLGTMFLVSYSGMLSKALGFTWQGHGPLDKVERLCLLIITAIAQWYGCTHNLMTVQIQNYNLSFLEICMILFFVLGQITVLRRTFALVKEAKVKEENE